MIDKEILDIVACPNCKKDLVLNMDKLLCKHCKKEYNIDGDIPILLD
ncbi:hypothetical protein HYV88_00090 [Candidatus Woesearchaeota archaeon]|nr:hypothetical protein [Candidatus Woesearchaeota archaeon]